MEVIRWSRLLASSESHSSSSTCGAAEVVALFNSAPSSVMVAPRAVAKELAASLS